MKQIFFYLAIVLIFFSCEKRYIYYGGGDGNDSPSGVLTIEYTLTEDDYKAIVANKDNHVIALSECPVDPITGSIIDSIQYKAFKFIADTLAFNTHAPAEIYVPAFLSEKFPRLQPGSMIRLSYNVLGRDSIIVETVTFSRYNVWVSAIYYRQAIAGDGDQGKLVIQDVIKDDELSYVWSFSNQYGMKASGFFGGYYETESWLVTPCISLVHAQKPQLSFDQARKFGADFWNECYVMVSTNYEGDVTECDWVHVPFNKDESGNYIIPDGSSWVFMNTGEMALSDFVGKEIHIAFKYTSSTIASCTWEIKNILVRESIE